MSAVKTITRFHSFHTYTQSFQNTLLHSEVYHGQLVTVVCPGTRGLFYKISGHKLGFDIMIQHKDVNPKNNICNSGQI